MADIRGSRHLIGCSLSVGFVSIILAGPLAGQSGRGRIQVEISSNDSVAAQLPLMISVVKGGEIINQNETLASSGVARMTTGVPAGSFDLRLEGEGVVTEVKRGIKIFPDKDTDLKFVIRRGTGVHIVEYAAGGLAREEVAARLNRLEAAVKKLEAAAPVDSASRRRSSR